MWTAVVQGTWPDESCCEEDFEYRNEATTWLARKADLKNCNRASKLLRTGCEIVFEDGIRFEVFEK